MKMEAGEFKELVRRTRSIRRFRGNEPVASGVLRELVDCARLVPSSANLQPLRYVICNRPDKGEEIFACLKWAGYLTDWPGPAPGERPVAYIVIVADSVIASQPWCDCGIAAQTIALYAASQGLGTCMLGALDRDRLRGILGLEKRYEILLVLALGRPAEQAVLAEVDQEHGIRYWRDTQGIHHVPKRSLSEVILKEFAAS